MQENFSFYEKVLAFGLLPKIKDEVNRQIVGGASDRTVRRVLQDMDSVSTPQQILIAKIANDVVQNHEQSIQQNQQLAAAV